MDASAVSGNIGAVATLLMGCLGAFFPARAAQLTNISPIGATGTSEIRATYGGLFVALGLACLLLQSSTAFSVAGFAWAGAAAGRVWSVAIDRNVEPKNLGGIGFELAFAVLLLAPWLSAI